MKTLVFTNVVCLILPLCLISCKKEYDIPPITQALDGAKITIAEIKSKFVSNFNYKFKSDSNLYCTVTADDVSGNLYKEIYVRDGSGAIHVKLKYSGGLYTGDSIRINLKNVVLNEYNRLIQLDSVDAEKSVVKLVSGLKVQPQLMTLEQIKSSAAATNTVQSKLIKISHVEFAETDRNVTMADAAGKTSKSLVLNSCSGQSITVRTSGYANFASKPSPSGNGEIIAIAGQYGGEMQLILRQYGDMTMSGSLCAETNSLTQYLKKDFNDNSITSGAWLNYKVLGNIAWATSTVGSVSGPYARISNYLTGSNQTCENWLISPEINLSVAVKPVLSFLNAYNYAGPVLEVFVSGNYTGGDPNSASWSKLNFTLSSGNWNFVNSGNVDLSAFKSGKIRIGFKYTGSNNDGSTWELDDILIREE